MLILSTLALLPAHGGRFFTVPRVGGAAENKKGGKLVAASKILRTLLPVKYSNKISMGVKKFCARRASFRVADHLARTSFFSSHDAVSGSLLPIKLTGRLHGS